MIGYKLFRIRKDGSLGPLFINRRQRVPLGEWLQAESHPTKGFMVREGWHGCHKPIAPHLATDRPDRVWCRVEFGGNISRYKRPESQGGEWLLASKLKVLEILGQEKSQ